MWGSFRLAPINRSVSVCYHKICCLPHFHIENKFHRFFMVFSRFLPFGFRWKHFVQEFWCHLLVSAAFCAPWRAFDVQTRQRWLLSTRIVCMASGRSSNTTGSSLIIAHWKISLLAICACYKLLTQYSTPSGMSTLAHVILLDIMQWRACVQCAFLRYTPRSVYVLLYY